MDSDVSYRNLLSHGLDKDSVSEESLDFPDLKGFQIERKLGQGGMGSVYLAVDTALNRHVALKVFDTKNFDPAALERFQQESQMMAKVDHPNVVRIYGVIASEDELKAPLCLVLEYVAGGDLGSWVAANGLPPMENVVNIVSDICDGLGAIHAQGIVHRDLKPANVLLTPEGKVKVADLGIAMDPTSDTLTQTGSYVGSVAYVAPEQMSQTRRDLDARTDIWALGVMMYELLTGELPQASLESDPVAKVPKHLRPIVGKCLMRNPQDRYASVAELKTALQKLSVSSSDRWKRYALVAGSVVLLLGGVYAFQQRNGQNLDETRHSIEVSQEDSGPEKSNDPVRVKPETAWGPESRVAKDTAPVNLINLLQEPISADSGVWRLVNDSLVCDAAERAACVSFPVESLGGNYDVSLDFIRGIGRHSLAVFLSTSIGNVTFELDAWDKGLAGIQDLNGQNLQQHSQVASFSIQNGRSYQLLLQVRKDEIRAYVDGKLVYTCHIAGSRGSIQSLWRMPRKYDLSIGAWASSFIFKNMILKKMPH